MRKRPKGQRCTPLNTGAGSSLAIRPHNIEKKCLTVGKGPKSPSENKAGKRGSNPKPKRPG